MQTACARAGEVLADAPLDNGDVDARQGELGRQHQARRTSSIDPPPAPRPRAPAAAVRGAAPPPTRDPAGAVFPAVAPPGVGRGAPPAGPRAAVPPAAGSTRAGTSAAASARVRAAACTTPAAA